MSPAPVKIVISGPVGAGKTTFISAVSESEVVNTDAIATEDIGKDLTTVAMDFGSFSIDPYTIYLFGTPGQERFDFMWEILCEGAVGLIVLVAGDSPRDFPKARAILDFITTQVPIPFIVGVTKQDLQRVWGPEEVSAYFDVPLDRVVALDARKAKDAMGALYHLFERINREAGYTADTAR